jgi:hypothetical protein
MIRNAKIFNFPSLQMETKLFDYNLMNFKFYVIIKIII